MILIKNYINEPSYNIKVDILIKSIDFDNLDELFEDENSFAGKEYNCRFNYIENGIEEKLDEGYENGLFGYVRKNENGKYELYQNLSNYYYGRPIVEFNYNEGYTVDLK